MTYKHVTRKQANIIYRAFKNGEIACDKKFIGMVYDFVDLRVHEYDDIDFMLRVDEIVRFICKGRQDLAQAIIDGKTVSRRYFITNIYEVTKEMVESGEHWFWHVGDIMTDKREEYVITEKGNPMTYRYFTKERPPMPGAIPMLDTLLDINVFEQRESTKHGGMAWGYADYSAPLTDQQIADYELSEGVEL